MKKMLLFLGNIFVVFCLVNSELVLPKCKFSDKECLFQATVKLLPQFAAGIPEYKVLATDPLYIESADASTPNLKMLVKKATMRGVKDCVVERSELTRTKIIGQILCDMSVDGQYEMKGKLLVIPIEGSGDVLVKLNQVRFYGEGDIVEYTGKDGKKHFKVKRFNHNFELLKKASLHFSSLFSRSDDLNKAVSNVINDNPNEIVKDIGGPSVEAVARAMFANINSFFKIHAIEDLFLPE